MWKLIIGNPWALVALFVLGLGFGGSSAWWVQGQRLDAMQAKFNGFIASVKAQGEAAEKLAKDKESDDKRIKENIDHDYETTLAGLRADNKRLRRTRAGSRIVPEAPTGSRNPGLACFDRPDLERTLQRFDEGLSGLFDEGDTNTAGLNVAREWVKAMVKQ